MDRTRLDFKDQSAVEQEESLLAHTPTPTKPADYYIDELVGTLFDPIIVCPAGGWENDLPEHLKKELPLHRLAHLMKCTKGEADREEATDLEALLYMYPASLAFPMNEQWTRIYLYLGTRALGEKFPEDIRQNELGQYDMGELRQLKRWIRTKKLEARKLRRRQEKEPEAETEAGTKPIKCEQVKFF